MGNMAMAIEVMTQAHCYETPWDDENQAVVKMILNDLIHESHW